MRFACMTANYVAREVGYQANTVSHDWGICHTATVDAFHGARFEDKFEALISDIRDIGFDAIELWVAHLDPFRATPSMIGQAVSIVERYGVEIIGYTAGFGTPGVSREDALRVFETAQAIGAKVLAQGFHPANGELVQELCTRYNIRVGLENHPEKEPQEVIEKVKPFYPWIGSANDTGWFATHGYDAARATRELRDVLIHVHLKDILAVGGHDTCALGDGIVDIRGVMQALQDMDYDGIITIEHEPMDHDPTEDCRTSLLRAQQWWSKLSEAPI
ncbi:sugar phosphate isomerase/epimerase family protein [Alicyclobacillus acidiphilus]|uniref:sugar phosphate isomerase/epimerase family protein n=1 Tax=Alicyclobacillus acidiphilus TaxID=182455 RepID=UPI00082C5012|nr:sugar phosphate isomerase/epimerase [Alicyclobacillus acidiphilus]